MGRPASRATRGGPGRGRAARAARAPIRGPKTRGPNNCAYSRRNCPALAGYLVGLRAANLRQLRPNRAEATYPHLRNLQTPKKLGKKLVVTFTKIAFFTKVEKKKPGPLRGPFAPNLGGKMCRPASRATRGGGRAGADQRARRAPTWGPILGPYNCAYRAGVIAPR